MTRCGEEKFAVDSTLPPSTEMEGMNGGGFGFVVQLDQDQDQEADTDRGLSALILILSSSDLRPALCLSVSKIRAAQSVEIWDQFEGNMRSRSLILPPHTHITE